MRIQGSKRAQKNISRLLTEVPCLLTGPYRLTNGPLSSRGSRRYRLTPGVLVKSTHFNHSSDTLSVSISSLETRDRNRVWEVCGGSGRAVSRCRRLSMEKRRPISRIISSRPKPFLRCDCVVPVCQQVVTKSSSPLADQKKRTMSENGAQTWITITLT